MEKKERNEDEEVVRDKLVSLALHSRKVPPEHVMMFICFSTPSARVKRPVVLCSVRLSSF